MRRILRTATVVFLAVLSACSGNHANQPLVVVQDGKYGFIDHTGRIIIRPQFVWATDFWRGLGVAYVCGHLVSIDESGTVVPLRGDAADGLEPRQGDGQKIGFVDARGRFIIKPSFDEVLPFSEGLAAVKVGEKWGFVDTRGKEIIRPQFDRAYYFHEGVATAEVNSVEILIDKSGKVLASGFSFIQGIPSHGRVPATKEDKSGFLDLQGHVVIPLIYDEVGSFSDGLAAVKQARKWGYIDATGRLVIPFEFDDAGEFGSGLAPVKIGTRTGFIDRSGHFAFDLAFRQGARFLMRADNADTVVANADVSRFWTSDDKFGYVNTSGRVIWGPTEGGPEHFPLLGETEEFKAESCQGISNATKAQVARLFSK